MPRTAFARLPIIALTMLGTLACAGEEPPPDPDAELRRDPLLRASNYAETAPAQFQVTLETSAGTCLLYTSPSPRDLSTSRMPSSA